MPGLDLFQSQRLSQEQTLSPQIIQALRILQTPSMELEREVADALAKNPLLEEIGVPAERMRVALPDPANSAPAEPKREDVSGAENIERDDWREPATHSTWSREDAEKRDFLFDSLAARPASLPQFLESQIALADVSAETRELLGVLVEHLDEKGFLDAPPEEIAAARGISETRMAAAAELFRSFDPPGIGARDLREAFMVQLRRLGKENSLAYGILDSAYPLFIKRKFAEIVDKFGVSDSELRAAIEEISKLKRVPAQDFIDDENRVVSPDLKFYFDEKSRAWAVRMNSDYVPRLRISNVYKEMLAQGKIPAKDRAYISEKMRDGRMIINAIEQRQATIEAIANVLADVQRDFFENGPATMRPLTMTEVATKIGVHETTVSRAVSGKYAETPWGVFELRKFFNAAIATDDGDAMSNAGVREVLREILSSESETAPLSDEKIAAELAARGIRVARRTVAKYRGIMNIPPAHLRKKF